MHLTPIFARSQPHNPVPEILSRLTGVAEDVRHIQTRIEAAPPAPNAVSDTALAPESEGNRTEPDAAATSAPAPDSRPRSAPQFPATVSLVPEAGERSQRIAPLPAPLDWSPLLSAVAQQQASTQAAFRQLLALQQQQARELEGLRHEVAALAARSKNRF